MDIFSVALLFSIAITIQWWLPSIGGFEAAKIAWLAIAGGALFLWGVSVWKKNTITIYRPKTLLPLAGLAIYLIIRGSFTAGPTIAWLGTEVTHLGVYTWLIIIAYLLVVVGRQWPTTAARLISWLALLLSVGSVLAVVVQFFGWDGVAWYNYDDPSRGRSIIGTIGAANQLGIVAVLLVFMIWPLQSSSSKRTRRVAVSATVMTGLLVLLTRSMTGIGLLLIGLGYQLLRKWGPTLQKPYLWTFCLIAYAIPFVLVTGLGSTWLTQNLPSLASRTGIWQSATQASTDHILFGYGPSHFQLAYDTHFPASKASESALTEERAHNQPLEILVEWGLVGLVLVGWLLWRLAYDLPWSETPLAAALWLIALSINFLTIPLVVIGLLLIAQNIGETADEPLVWRGWVIWVASVTSLAVIVGLAAYGFSLWLTSNRLDASMALENQGGFTSAALTIEPSLSGPFSQPFGSLLHAESLTNDALQYSDWTNWSVVSTNLTTALQEAPFAHNQSVALRILAVWAPHNIAAAQQYRTLAQDFQNHWSNHPKYRELLATLPAR